MEIGPAVARTLVVEDDQRFVDVLGIMLGQDGRLEHHLTTAQSLADAGTKIEATRRNGGLDVIILDLSLPDSTGPETLDSMVARADGVPIVVLTSTAEWDFRPRAIALGAEDYVVKDGLAADVLNTAVRHAVERRWLRQEVQRLKEQEAVDRELREMTRMAGPPAPTADSADRPPPLSEVNPELFSRLVVSLETTLDAAVDQRRYQSATSLTSRLDDLATILVRMRATPRDVMALYSEAISRRSGAVTRRETGVLLEEGRLLVLELMGLMTAGYRVLSMERP